MIVEVKEHERSWQKSSITQVPPDSPLFQPILCTIYLEPGLELNNDFGKLYCISFFSRTCKCEVISETRKASIANNYCYSLITLSGSPYKIILK